MKATWTGDKLWDALNLSWSEFSKKYPDIKRNTYKGKRHYWRNKLLKGEIEMPPSPEAVHPEREQIIEELVDGNLVSQIDGWWDVVTANPEDPQNPTVTRAYKHSTKVRPTDEDLHEAYVPATPARITPSRRKPPVRDHRILYVFSDAQIDYRRKEDGSLEPIHDERALRVGHLICKDLQPDEIINTGDTVDLAALSRFPLDSNQFQRTLGPSFQRAHDLYAQFRADVPHAQITEVDSNHNTRLKKHFLKNAPEFYGFRRPGAPEDEYPMMTYPYFANLGKLGVKWVSGYGSAEYVYGEEYGKPPIIFKHGMTSVSGGSTASKESRSNPENHVVRGHSHRTETAYRTTRQGHYLASIVVGASCRITGEVPSYYSAVDDNGEVVKYQENWTQSVLVVRDYQGEYQFDHIMIRDGKAFYNGKEYSGDES